mgnify:CR=1 FL=1
MADHVRRTRLRPNSVARLAVEDCAHLVEVAIGRFKLGFERISTVASASFDEPRVAAGHDQHAQGSIRVAFVRAIVDQSQVRDQAVVVGLLDPGRERKSGV